MKNKLFKKNGEEVLLLAKKALDSIGVFFWLDFGTLLGVYRNGNLIKKDLDLDISIFLNDYTSKIDESMLKHGFKKIEQFEIEDKKYGLEQTYKYKGVTIDIFYYTKNENTMYMHSFTHYSGYTWQESINKKGGCLTIEAYLPINGFTKTVFLNTEFNIPTKPEEHLKYHYGDDFLIPKKWDYTNLEIDNRNAKFRYDKIGTYIKYK